MNYITVRSESEFNTLMSLLPNRPTQYCGPSVVMFHVEGDSLQHFEVLEIEVFTAAYWIAVYDAFMARNCPRSPIR